MDVGINNLLAWLDLPEEQVWAMGTRNPAKLLNLPGHGTLVPGAAANVVLWDRDPATGYQPAATWVDGRLAWSRLGTLAASVP